MASQSKLWHLENINLLKDLCDKELGKVEQMTTMKTHNKGQYIYFPEEPSSNVYFLKEGQIKLGSYSDDGKEITKAILSPGEVFGELALVGEDKRNDFAQALDDNVTICAMSREDMERLMEDNSKLTIKITKIIGLRLRKIEMKYSDLIFKDVRTRIVDFLKELANEQGTQVGDEIMIKHRLTHQDIANLTATTRQTVTTILNELKDNDEIYMERKKFLIRNIDTLGQ
ncbi:MAG: Crp/Fnr family transcriptional regulator [Flavobacteriales bacterium]|nr:Crp/Fnr family transcriptional regulator [Flavobacteriales bacterium]